jgi:ribose 5-phosphate isomerase A
MASSNESWAGWTSSTKIASNPIPPKRTVFPDPSSLSAIEKAKRLAAHAAVDDHFPKPAKVVGIGSGSTIIYAVERILQLKDLEKVVFVPTGFQSRELIVQGGLRLGEVSE